jgi:hypothetical protein
VRREGGREAEATRDLCSEPASSPDIGSPVPSTTQRDPGARKIRREWRDGLGTNCERDRGGSRLVGGVVGRHLSVAL